MKRVKCLFQILLFYVLLTNGKILQFNLPITHVILPPGNGQFVIIQNPSISRRPAVILNSNRVVAIFEDYSTATRFSEELLAGE